MKKLIIIAAIFLMASCTKENNTTVVNTGIIRYTNQSPNANRYEIYLDGTKIALQNSQTYYDKKEVPTGSHIVKAIQYEGFALYPTIVEKTVIVNKGITIEFQFP